MRISEMLATGKNVEAYWASGPNEMYEGQWSAYRASMTQHKSGAYIGVLNAKVVDNNIKITGNLAGEDINVIVQDLDIGQDLEYRIPIQSELGSGEILLNA